MIRKELKDIADYFGMEAQTSKTIEECCELIRELVKADDIEHLTEEIADTYIMIMQIIYLFDLEDSVKKVIKEKINRTLERYEISTQ